MAGNSTVPGQSVSGKLLAILDAFAGDRATLTMSEIARSTGLPTSTTHRLLQELAAWGGLERTPDGRYGIGIRLWEIATRSVWSYDAREVVMPFLQGLWESTKAHILLVTIQGSQGLVIERIVGTRDVPPASRVGGRLPLHASSSGKILLASAEQEFVSELLSAGLPRHTQSTIVNPAQLLRELEHIRATGIATSPGELIEGTHSCAALIPGPADLGNMAVSILSSTGARDPREMEALVRMTARGISNGLARRHSRLPSVPPVFYGSRTGPPQPDRSHTDR